jgi:hypothetical protein
LNIKWDSVQNKIEIFTKNGGHQMVKDSHAPKEKRNGNPKQPPEQRDGRGKSNARGGRN